MIIKSTPTQVGYVVFRHARLITIMSLSIFGLACLYCLVATPKYDAKASLVAEFSALPSGVPGGAESSAAPVSTPMDHEEIVNSYIGELDSTELLRRIVDELGPNNLYPKHFSLNPLAWLPKFDAPASANLAHEDEVDEAVRRLIKKDLKVEAQRDANVINIELLNPDRHLAVEFVRRLTEGFLQMDARISHNPRLNFVQDQVEKYRKTVTDAQDAMSRFQKANGISSIGEERTVLIQQRALLEQSLMANQSKAVESQARYQALSAELQKISPVVTTSQNDRDPMELSARTNLADLEAREAELGSEYGLDSPAIEDIKRSVTASKELLLSASHTPPLTHADPNQAYQQLQVTTLQAKGDWTAAQQSTTIQNQQYLDLGTKLAALDAAESQYQNLVRDYQIADQNYRVYLQGVQEARVAEDLDKAKVTSVAVFDAPYAPPKPVRPGILVLLFGAIGGVVFSVLVAFILEALDDTLERPEQIAELLNLPVLGSIRVAR